MSAVHVLAMITCRPGMRARVLELFKQNVPKVHAEKGCIEYEPVVDLAGFGAFQMPVGPESFVVVEKWASADALRAHAAAPHMRDYAAKTRDFVASRKVYVLTKA
jgi:quinol monooxygenase YgiN